MYCERTIIRQFAAYFVLCSIVAVLIVFSVKQSEDLRRLHKRLDEVTNKTKLGVEVEGVGERTSDANAREGKTKEILTWVETRVNETERSLKSGITSLRSSTDFKLSKLRRELLDKPIYLNLSLLRLMDEVGSLISTAENLTAKNSSLEFKIQHLARVLNNTRNYLSRLEKELSHLNASLHSKHEGTSESLTTSLKIMRQKLTENSNLTALKISQLRADASNVSDRIDKILVMMSQQNTTLSSKIEDVANFISSMVDRKLSKLRNSTKTKMRQFQTERENVWEKLKELEGRIHRMENNARRNSKSNVHNILMSISAFTVISIYNSYVV